MKVRSKLLLGFIAVSLTTAIVGGIGWWGMAQSMNSISELGKESIPSIVNLEVIKVSLLEIKSAMRTLMVVNLPRDDYMRQFDNIEQARSKYKTAFDAYEKLNRGKDEEKLWKAFRDDLDDALKANNKFLDFVKMEISKGTDLKKIESSVISLGMNAKDPFDTCMKSFQALVDFVKDLDGVEKVNSAIAGSTALISLMVVALIASIIAAVILAGVFGTMLTSPLSIMEKGLAAMAEGELKNKMNAKSSDEFGKIANSYNAVYDTLGSLIQESKMLTVAAVEGKLSTRGNPDQFKGGYKAIVEGVNKTLDAVIGPLNVTARYVDDVSKGIIPPIITDNYNGEFNVIKNNLNTVVKMMGDLLKETDGIIKSAADGELDKRANADMFQGGWKQLVSGVNDTITNIVNPLMVTADYVDKVSKGIIPPEITTVYKGQYNIIKVNLNSVVKMMDDLLKETDGINKAAIGGELSKRANAEMFMGGWNKLVSGVNKTLDAVIVPLNVAADYVDKISNGNIPSKITDSYNGDFNKIKNNLNQCIDAINALVADAVMLAQAGVDGKLTTRADATKHQGDFKKIVDGVNSTLDSVIQPINELIAIFQKMSEGDLTSDMKGDFKGDFATLKNALNLSLGSINEILGQVNMAIDQVSAGSIQVSQASQSLSQGSTEQASSLEEITSSITEISSQTKQNTDNAVQVNGLAKNAKENAEQGNSQMKDLVSAMTDINKSSDEIKKIVKTIDDIAFQINLLALNANVEAARAGKYGKGFAVVADEVRNLAVRSTEAVKETTRMVEESINSIGNGNRLVEVTAKQLDEIVSGAAKVADLAEEVATASKEQSQGLEQISSGLGQIDQVTQSNTANAEESASAAEELSSQAQQLKVMISKFRLRQESARKSLGMGDMSPEILEMIRSEVNKNQLHSGHLQNLSKINEEAKHAVKKAEVKASHKSHLVNPKDVISLDDDNFGKF